MVRISGGIYRGRQLRVPRSGVRPTKDMVRQALFSAIGETIAGKRVVDLFAGSGAIGLEAVSRGAADVVWVEENPRTFDILRGNVSGICGGTSGSFRCIRADAFGWLRSSLDAGGYDLVVADPPYLPEEGEEAAPDARKSGTGTVRTPAKPAGAATWGARLLSALADSNKLKPEGLFVLEQHADQPVIDNPPWHIVKQSRYGETRLVYYRRSNPVDTGTPKP